jgi:hypothetical protein
MGLIKQYMPLTRIIMIVAIASIVMGAVFIAQGVIQADWIKDAMRQEKVTVGLGHGDGEVPKGEYVDSMKEAQAAGDVIREHRRGIAETYNELLGEGRYDPTNPEHLSYAQALNMENYLYLGVLGFGVIQISIAAGSFMILSGIGLGVVSLALRRRTL